MAKATRLLQLQAQEQAGVRVARPVVEEETQTAQARVAPVVGGPGSGEDSSEKMLELDSTHPQLEDAQGSGRESSKTLALGVQTRRIPQLTAKTFHYSEELKRAFRLSSERLSDLELFSEHPEWWIPRSLGKRSSPSAHTAEALVAERHSKHYDQNSQFFHQSTTTTSDLAAKRQEGRAGAEGAADPLPSKKATTAPTTSRAVLYIMFFNKGSGKDVLKALPGLSDPYEFLMYLYGMAPNFNPTEIAYFNSTVRRLITFSHEDQTLDLDGR
ncbi:unnamed protein product [Amoebophrya sp. A25]|nr:unnamed protein product [Amoebophrya sp. A25]|eukprot:GSA25T00026310001.1